MRQLTLLFVTALLLACTVTRPTAEDWIPLFNGTDLTGWDIKIAGRPLNDNFRNTFRVEDDMIRISYDDYESFDDAYGHLYYRQPYSHYKLKFEYRFTGEQTPGGAEWNVRNSGVMLHSQSAASNDYGQTFPVSVELQLLGGLGKGPRTTGNVCTPGTAVVMGDTIDYRHCISSSSRTYNGDGWVKAEAVVLGGEAMHFLIEGDTVLSFKQPQIGGGFTRRSGSQDHWEQAGFTDSWQNWVKREGEILTEGYIALQAESHPIDFRNIKLLDLSK
ncbi:hypothetical protein GGR28_000559 [Lewinella aquimaris]|uniref:3-keto-alpha-glucoside-1,2-lyase/3-keto-2-hydroxy-glucal hydratase domain-containing protein n=1 Tax=Neolewinella aquimaris TaxID=1835722 RepID=A0A840E7A8_9BACT|nr:DUF1080 domain-containing protein [Neolewinella aquimaris]MBB4077958.1 hypothetical protein [Neolewinella aquimaris]